MALDADAMASDIKDGLGAPEVTPEIEGIATSVVSYMQTGIVSFPGTIVGASPDGSDATGLGGLVVLAPGGLVSLFATVFIPPTPQTIAMATAIETFLLTGIFSLGAGDITGTCAAGVWTGGASGGAVAGYLGATLAPLIASAVMSTGVPPVTPEIQGLADAIANHITDNIELSFLPGTIIGTCPPPPAPPTGPVGGVGVGGLIL